MSIFRKITSYIFPFSRKIYSDINGVLEVNWLNGKKVLDSPNANYSFGNLQKVLHFGLSKVFNNSIHNTLVLGMGGGSVIHSLRNDFNYSGKITAVEIDPVVFQLAQTEFGLVASLDLILILQDAKDYMQNNNETFDLIIVDIFIDTEVPTPFMEKEFWTNIHKAMNPKAKVIFNYMDPAGSPSSFKTMLQYLDFDIQEYTYVLDTNSILILS